MGILEVPANMKRFRWISKGDVANLYDGEKYIGQVDIDYLPFVLTALNTQAEANADLPL